MVYSLTSKKEGMEIKLHALIPGQTETNVSLQRQELKSESLAEVFPLKAHMERKFHTRQYLLELLRYHTAKLLPSLWVPEPMEKQKWVLWASTAHLHF